MLNSRINYLLLCLSILIFSSCGGESVKTVIYSLNFDVSPPEGGKITESIGDYQEGEVVTINAIPEEEWFFDGWTGDAESTSNPLSITMDSDKSITANFAKLTYSLNITILGEGTVGEKIVQQKMADYELGTVVELTPEPSDGWRFIEWREDLTGDETPAQVVIDAEKNITAVFSNIYLANNGVTIMCPKGEVGEIGVINGVGYEVVDKELLRQRINEDVKLSQLCVSRITNMNGLFEGYRFNQDIGNWDVSSVTDMGNMFRDSRFNQDISSWDVAAVTSMRSMFEGADIVFNQPIGNWDVSSVTDMSYMFFNNIVFNQPIGEWDVGNVTDMTGMFWAEEGAFDQPIGNWDVSSVTSMEKMFAVNAFNQSIGSWDVSSVTTMEEMFWYSQFNQSIGNWDVSNVTNMDGMFMRSPFNQPINGWCVDQLVNREPSFFSYGSPLVDENKPVWGTCPAN